MTSFQCISNFNLFQDTTDDEDDLEKDPTWDYLDHQDLESIPEAMKGPVTTGLRFKLSSFAIMLMINQVLTMVNRDDLMVSRQVI